MIGYTASWVVPISERPIRDGWVAVDSGRVVSHGRPGAAPPGVSLQDLGAVAIMPGLVNAHTHLELSHLRHAIPPAASFVEWVRQLLSIRRQFADPRDPVIMAGVDAGIAEAVRAGTVLVGDISNSLVTFDALARSPLSAVVFHELLGFRLDDAEGFVAKAAEQMRGLPSTDRVRASLAAHAPYSVAPAMYRAIRRAVEEASSGPYCIHLSESPEEVQFIRSGDGPWREMLEQLGAWNPDWQIPGVSPVEYVDDQQFLGPRAIAVHGVQMSAGDLERLARRETTVVTCPRSNAYVGVGAPPIEQFFASGVRVAVGTDSLASTTDLNLFSELAEMRRLAPGVPAARLLDSATRQGAVALGFETDYGTIAAGKRAALLAVSAPAGLAGDVEEYLVSGIQPEQIQWI